MIVLKSANELAIMRVAGSIVAKVLADLEAMICPGITLKELNRYAENTTRKYKVVPAFKGYQGFPAALCTSINEQVVHGIPNNYVLREGDIVGLDFGVVYKDYYGDAAITVPVGKVSDETKRLLQVTKEALYQGITKALVGNKLFDISRAIQNHVENNHFSVVRDFVGHGIGRQMHEAPQIPNFVGNDYNPRLKKGMTLAVEPMVNVGGIDVEVDAKDNWTVRTLDRQFSAHFEHTIAVTEGEPEILTLLRPELLPEVK